MARIVSRACHVSRQLVFDVTTLLLAALSGAGSSRFFVTSL